MCKKSVWLPVFRNVVPADYEAWLEALALEGWHVGKIDQFSSFVTTFHKAEPRQYRYAFDLNLFPHPDYFSAHERLGWEFVGRMASCFVWRKAYQGNRPEPFYDEHGVMRRNRRVKNTVLVGLVLFLLALAACLAALWASFYTGNTEKVLELVLESALFALIAGYLWWVVCRINRSIRR